MAETKRVEIGFEGGQVISVAADRRRLEGPARAVAASARLARPRDRGRRSLPLYLGKVVFVRIDSRRRTRSASRPDDRGRASASAALGSR